MATHQDGFARAVLGPLALLCLAIVASGTAGAATTGWTVIGWNDLGMHCMDADYSVFSILPPFNNLNAQVIDGNGRLVTDPSRVRLSYEAVADPGASFNSTSIGKTNFWSFAPVLYGVSLAPDVGLAGCRMPGTGNVPQPLAWNAGQRRFIAEGIPITPRDDAGRINPYPLMRVVARDPLGNLLAETRVVLPVSDEMDCSACHRSGAVGRARPAAGWANDADFQRDYRLNILRKHDERQLANPVYTQALARLGLDPGGLFASASGARRPVLCAACHASNALPGSGIAGIPPLTQALHGSHARARDPMTGLTLDDSGNREACYRCHPGSTTRCLRGAMGAAVAADGSMAMQCQSCHGNMSKVGAAGRQGWLQEPSCQNCHTGTATINAGSIRFDSAFDAGGSPRAPADRTFATSSNVPAAGLDLYRFSTGHGGLACSACHGSTHAEFPSTHANDNLQSEQLQGHAGMLVACENCHRGNLPSGLGGPHGMHAVGQRWISSHGDVAEGGNLGRCRACHGADDRGTELSQSQSNWTANTGFGTRTFWRGFRIGCYTCHEGPNSESGTRNRAPVVSDVLVAGTVASATTITLPASDPDNAPLTLRIVTQPAAGTVALNGREARYFPQPGFRGDASFTFAASDGRLDSNLGRVAMRVDAPAIHAIGAEVSGTYFDPAQPGHGWLIEGTTLNGAPGIVATWSTYLNGQQLWLFGAGPATGGHARVELSIATGGAFPPAFDPAAVRIAPWGEAQFDFESADRGRVRWTTTAPGFNNGTMPLQRASLPALPASGESSVGRFAACHSGTWFDPALAGHGLTLEVLDTPGGRVLVATWFVFKDGQQRWLLGQGAITGADAVLATVITSGSGFPPAFDPATVRSESWGTLRLTAIDGNHLRLGWNSVLPGYGSGSLDLTRLTDLLGRSCAAPQ
jgi:hypothetical protein